MITIGNIPRKTKAFFIALKSEFSQPAFNHFWALVVAMTISRGSTIDILWNATVGHEFVTPAGKRELGDLA